jgi:hypothetical protein
MSRSKQHTHPYAVQPPRAFWNKAVRSLDPFDLQDLYIGKFNISDKAIMTAGSCFAQHIGGYLKKYGYHFLDTEPCPSHLPESLRKDYGYDLYSARYGNIYSSRQLLQLFQQAFGEFNPTERFWVRKQGVVDPFRPTIEPHPLESVEEVERLRRWHLERVRELFLQAEVVFFTLGLTEAWESTEDGAIFPIVPGASSGGVFDPGKYRFRNLTYPDILQDCEQFIQSLRKLRPEARFLFTVSPVSLMATATDQHVLVATEHSKSILRAVAGQLAREHDYVDYFPSYELITAPFSCVQSYQADGRGIAPEAVAKVMECFLNAHKPPAAMPEVLETVPGVGQELPARQPAAPSCAEDDVLCDEEILAAFAALD